jgi:hypothetical protein
MSNKTINRAGQQCSVDGCGKPVYARRMCPKHYRRQLRNNAPLCSVQGCDKHAPVRGMCDAHWRRWRKYGDPLAGSTVWGTPAKFFSDVVLLYSDPDTCLIWPFSTSRGYGYLYRGGKNHLVHRLVCIEAHGPPPFPGAQACHGECHNRRCVNPRHVYWGSPTDNNGRDKVRDGTTNRGERSHSAKLTAAKVRQIHRTTGTHNSIARRFGVSRSCVGAIKMGQSWRNLGLGVAPGAGIKARGEDIGLAKLTTAEVRQIHRASGRYRVIAVRFGIHHEHVGRIKRGEAWKHLGLPPQTKKRSRAS